MKTRGKEDHDVGLLAASIFDLLVRDFIKGQWCHSLPDLKRQPDGFVWVILANLWSVVLDTVRTKSGGGAYFSQNFKLKLFLLVYLQVNSYPNLNTPYSHKQIQALKSNFRNEIEFVSWGTKEDFVHLWQISFSFLKRNAFTVTCKWGGSCSIYVRWGHSVSSAHWFWSGLQTCQVHRSGVSSLHWRS